MDRTLPPELLATLVDPPTRKDHMTDTATDPDIDKEARRKLIYAARKFTAEHTYKAFIGYLKIIDSIIGEDELKAMSHATGRTVEELTLAHEAGNDLLPQWDELSDEQQEGITLSDEMDQVGWYVVHALKHTLNPEAEPEEKPKRRPSPFDDIIDRLIDGSVDVTIIQGTFRG
jgi:hypothetical protein